MVNVPALQVLFSAYDVAAGHYRRYDRASLVAELAGDAWEVVDVRYWGLTLVPLLALRKMLLRDPSDETIRRGFGPPSRLAHACLRGLMRLEMAVMPTRPSAPRCSMVARSKRVG